MSDTDAWVQDIIELHQAVHQQLREEIANLDSAALNWTPAPDTSSVGTIVTHALGAEAEMLRNLLQIPTDRDRDAEFAAQSHTPDSLVGLLDTADDDLQHLATRLGEGGLRAVLARPHKPVPQSGLYWLVRNYGHLREHLAQVWLTKQLYEIGRQRA